MKGKLWEWFILASLATLMVLWYWHCTVLVLDNDY